MAPRSPRGTAATTEAASGHRKTSDLSACRCCGAASSQAAAALGARVLDVTVAAHVHAPLDTSVIPYIIADYAKRRTGAAAGVPVPAASRHSRRAAAQRRA